MQTSVQKLKQMVADKEMQHLAGLVFVAMAWEETVRPVVIQYQDKILAQMKPVSRYDGKVITLSKDSYKMSDEDFEVYSKLCNQEREKAGLHVENDDFCPLLVAENMTREAKRAMVIAAAKFTGIDSEAIFYSLQAYYKYVELILEMMAQTADQQKILASIKAA